MNAREEIYLDNAATSLPKAPGVAEAMADFVTQIGASPMRGAHQRALAASRVVFETREALARLLGAADSSRVVLMPSATEALCTAITGSLRPGDHVQGTRI